MKIKNVSNFFDLVTGSKFWGAFCFIGGVFRVFYKILVKILGFLIAIAIFYYLFLVLGEDYIFNQIATGKVFDLGVSVFSPLAITLAFSGLMYNRARAINSRTQRFRSLYLAERFFEASKHYGLTLLSGFVCFMILNENHWDLNLSGSVKENPASLIMIIPLMFFLSFCLEIFLY